MPAPTAASAVSPQSPPGKARAQRRRKWPWLLAALCVLGGAGGVGWWQFQAAAAHAPERKPAAPARAPVQYHAIEPAFVVNLADDDAVRYLQADVQLVTRDPATLAAFDTHAPAIRNRLLLLFGQQSSASLAQRSGKERLQEAARDEVRRVLKREGAADKVEAVIFTSLVTQ
ncbi:MAG TPA: flagellar basal body-associated FliL family protein [Luteimonas sp.]|nr:flagellar basal body-associated FliL family protein [Luteimonas sp.]